ncbi:MAG: hypothetical protein M3P51_04885 [Chloroflexota bacterium]|nr:hypothetical protein [Chloroflexota bacterium]
MRPIAARLVIAIIVLVTLFLVVPWLGMGPAELAVLLSMVAAIALAVVLIRYLRG